MGRAGRYQRDRVKSDIERKLQFLDFAKFHYISALQGKGVGGVFKSVDGAYAAAMAKMSTPKLTRVLIAAVEKQQPPKWACSAPRCATPTRAATTRR